ncbi:MULTISPECIES: TetR/AcrR family transcriptional regulator [unclassified Rhodococcus (in: high G+C Gram-positive bacteria)]|uniref:TetR/AcrR family transcriptional regulator n=1 Tax=unclassified Rhodococcus (in: high G+C Gram-positive bacteria) TaxID=192944 RepID=UPI0021C80A5A|nr:MULTISPECIES: helix-turn-helix domain-containing protein [unclassified Rhodococcus (in: high G+C Gram-positive bacteria)]
MTDGLTQILRADAKENRDRIVEVAREVFASDGLGISMREVARRAEVGPATLYRRFPPRRI